MARKLFEGLRIIDFGWVATGPLTTKYFSDLGAEVFKIESRARLDSHRNPGPGGKGGIPGVNRNAPFNMYATSKLSVSINIAHPKGLELIKRLIARADVVVDNMTAGAMEKLGLGYEELKKVKPDIIMLSSCGLGHTGPYAKSPAHGTVLAALSGISQISGWPDRDPIDLGNYTDWIGPHFNAIAILAALDHRRRTGEGQYLDMSQYEQGLQFMTPLLLDWVVNRRTVNRMGNRSPYAAPHGAFRCQGTDRWCAIAVSNDNEWRSFCRVIGNPAWTKDTRFSTFLARKKNEDELEKQVEEWTINHSAEEVMAMLQKGGVPAGVLQTGEDLMEHDPQMKHQGFFQALDHPEIGKYRSGRAAFTLSKAPYVMRTAPLLNGHTEYAMKEILGLSDNEVAELVTEGVLK